MATKGTLGVFIDSKTVFAAFSSGAEQSSCAVPVAGVPEDLDYDAKITDAIRTASRQLTPDLKTALLAVPGEAAMVRCFELPSLPKKEEETAIRFEAQKYVPFELKDLCYDYDTLPDAARRRIRVLFYAAKKSTVERLVSTVENAGLSVSAIETLSNSLARSFNQEIVKNSGAAYMLIRTNADQTAEVIIARNQTVLVSRHVVLAEQPGSPQWDPTSFLAEIRISFDYFDEIFKGQTIEKIYVSSPSREEMQALTETIHRGFSLTVEAVSSAAPGVAAESAAGLAVAHGLALRNAPNQKGKKINLQLASRPTDAAQNKATLKDFATKALLASAVAFGAVFFLTNQFVQSRQADLRRLTSTFPNSPTTPASLDKAALQDRKTALDTRLDFFSEVFDRRRFFTEKMNALAKNTPEGVRLSTFTYDDDVSTKGTSYVLLRLEGVTFAEDQAAGLTIINKLVSGLNADKEFMQGFSQIKIYSTKQIQLANGSPAVRFELECASRARVDQ